MHPVLAEAFAEIIDEYREALIWCSEFVDKDDKGLYQHLIDDPARKHRNLYPA